MAILQNKTNFYRILSDILPIGRALELLASEPPVAEGRSVCRVSGLS
jgi:hypothetical protein